VACSNKEGGVAAGAFITGAGRGLVFPLAISAALRAWLIFGHVDTAPAGFDKLKRKLPPLSRGLFLLY